MVSFVIDSGVDVTEGYRKNFAVVPIKTIIDGEEYRNEVELKEILQANREGRKASTSQPSIKDFLDVFQRLEEPIFYIGISGKLSGTLQSANNAARMSGKDVRVFDTRSISFGAGLLAMHAWDNRNKPLEDLESELSEMRDLVKLYVVLKTLKYVMRSGRISTLKGTVGEFLDIKPILTIKDGELIVLKKVRGYEKALEDVAEKVANRDVIGDHIDSEGDLDKIKATAKSFERATICPALGVHTGEGVAVGFLEDSQ